MNKDDIDKGLRYMQGGFTKALLNAKFGMHVVDTDVNQLFPNFINKEVNKMKDRHFQIGDTIYYYNRCKNKIEAHKVEAIAWKDNHIVYNYIYDDSSVKGSYGEILTYAVNCINDEAASKINALNGGE